MFLIHSYTLLWKQIIYLSMYKKPRGLFSDIIFQLRSIFNSVFKVPKWKFIENCLITFWNREIILFTHIHVFFKTVKKLSREKKDYLNILLLGDILTKLSTSLYQCICMHRSILYRPKSAFSYFHCLVIVLVQCCLILAFISCFM